LPPRELRELVGQPDPAGFENPTRTPVYPYLPASAYDAVFDFGCGCGRVARQLLLQEPRPQRYVGIDIHRGMVLWCRENLTPLDPAFEFHHHDVFAAGLNPTGRHRVLPLPAGDGAFTLLQAYSIFTHLVEDQAVHYLREAARVLRSDGYLHSTWFLFEKRYFPMMQDFQNALFINDVDPTNAVIFDRDWLVEATRAAGLVVAAAHPPAIRGFQWTLVLRPRESGADMIELPADEAPFGRNPPPLLRAGAASLAFDNRAQ
jgi:SAM-dependent methyltransferase